MSLRDSRPVLLLLLLLLLLLVVLVLVLVLVLLRAISPLDPLAQAENKFTRVGRGDFGKLRKRTHFFV